MGKQETVEPIKIFDIGYGFWRSKVLLSAVGMGLFTELSGTSMTGGELGEALGLHERSIFDFLDALVALGFLERDGDGPDARYRNGCEAAAFLDKNDDRYIGAIFEMFNARLFRFWADLDEGLRTGEPQNEVKHSGKTIFEELYADPAKLEQFMRAMHGVSAPNFAALAERFDFGKHQTLCDVGGASGLLSICVARANPHMKCVSFDLPVVEPIARRAIAKAGLQDRIETAAGDFFSDPLPRADVVTMGMILHDWNLEKKMHLIRAAYDALPKGGAFVVIESLIDDQRRSNAHGLLMSLNMLIEFGDAFDYSGADFTGWCSEVGFDRCEVMPLAGNSSAAIAYK
jgi:tRNA A58 N-methylase Trm61